ncbi:MAG TPA: hypothetical protein VFS76_05090 [Pyrinomonadaceae bacterium]|nr:hypothetical protein [Pyrinomonadaceae bacterium]
MPLKTYDESLDFLRKSLYAAKLGDREKIDGFRRLDGLVRTVETNLEPRADFDAVIKHEHGLQRSLF